MAFVDGSRGEAIKKFMNKKISIGAAVALIIIAVSLTVSATMVIAMRQFNYKMENVNQRQQMFDYITEVDKAVRQHYVGDIDEETLRASLAQGYIAGINDPYAAYLTPAEYHKETERLSGKWTGLGLDVTKKDFSVVISAVDKDSAADKAGVQKGDVITSLNGSPVSSSKIDDVKSTLDGADKAMITVSRSDQSIAFEISPSTYTVNSIESRLIGTTGYIRISAFYANTLDQFKDAYTALEAQGAQNYIFDLRYNAGGSIDAACAVINYLIPRGTYAHRTAAGGTVTDLSSEGSYEITKSSVTLVNGSTEGEAELFAGVLQEFNKTAVIGVQTAGRGRIQELFNVSSDGAAIKLSVATLSLADGNAIENVGITPSITVGLTNQQEANFAFLTENDDPQLITALNALKGNLLTETTTQPSAAADSSADTGSDVSESSGSPDSVPDGGNAVNAVDVQ